MNKEEYWQTVNILFDKLVADFRHRYNESIDTEFLYEVRIGEIERLWSFSDYIIGFNGAEPIYDGGPLRYVYSALADGKRDYDNQQHLELDAYLQFKKWLEGEPTIWDKATTKGPTKIRQYNIGDTGKLVQNENIPKMRAALENQDLNEFFKILKAIFASAPYYLSKQNESDFHRDFHLILTLSDFKIESEVPTNQGRIDSVVETKNIIYIMEFKITDVEEALTQIKKRKYYEKYMNKGKRIIPIGVTFNTKEKNISNWHILSIES
jgi:hypothetical protein